MDHRTEYIGFHVTPSVKAAAKREAQKSNHFLSKWLFLTLLAFLKAKGYKVSETQ